MDYEKKYKEALERAREINNKQKAQPFDVMLKVFPELKESEDEKIRKELITHCRNTRYVTEEGAERMAKWIAWLEKQGEQKEATCVAEIIDHLTEKEQEILFKELEMQKVQKPVNDTDENIVKLV